MLLPGQRLLSDAIGTHMTAALQAAHCRSNAMLEESEAVFNVSMSGL